MTDSQSPNVSEELKQQLQALVPAAFKDGQLDVEALQHLLGLEATLHDERYGLNWAGKADSYKALQYPTSATLRPRVDQSVNFDHAQHVFIEGENLEVLKTLQRSYFGKMKMIYIDPPYNTGSDSFIYPDRFQESREDYLKRIESLDIDGNITKEGLFRKNNKDNGHYHSNWLSMMLPRLYLARNLLRDDGVIFISIDDNEAANLKLLCDEVFGAENFVDQLVWKKLYGGKNDSKWFLRYHDYVICYAKNKENWFPNLLERTETQNARYKNPDNDPRGVWKSGDFTAVGESKSCIYQVKNLTGRLISPPRGKRWIVDENSFNTLLEDNRIWFGVSGDGVPNVKRFLSEVKDGIIQSTILDYSEVGHSDGANRELKALMGGGYFDYPKPIELIKRFVYLGTQETDIILDFFAGSGTTAQAVMELNLEDGGNRQYICVQMPEPTNDASEAYKAGYKSIADISRDRIRLAIEKIKKKADLASPLKENDSNLAFRAFELAPSNFKHWRGDWAETTEELDQQLALMLPTEKSGATSLDMAFELLLKNGRPLVSQVELKTIVQTPVYIVWSQEAESAENTVVLMFLLEGMQLEALPEMLALKPKHVVFLDSVFKNNDSVKVNVALQCESAGIKFSSI